MILSLRAKRGSCWLRNGRLKQDSNILRARLAYNGAFTLGEAQELTRGDWAACGQTEVQLDSSLIELERVSRGCVSMSVIKPKFLRLGYDIGNIMAVF